MKEKRVFENLHAYAWSNNTAVLYFVIVITSSFFSWASNYKIQKNAFNRLCFVKRENGINKLLFFSSFLILWFFQAFSDVGTDRPVYKNIFLWSNSETTFYNSAYGFSSIEKGYVLLNRIIRLFTSNKTIFFAIVSFVTLFLIFSTIYYFKDRINIGASVLGYASLFYIQSFSLIRIYLASAILFYAIRYLITSKNIKYLICVVIAFFIHTSAIFMFLPFLLFFIYEKNKKISAFIVLGVFTLLYIKPNTILLFASNFERYADYVNKGFLTSGSGIAQIIYFAPLFFIFLITRKKAEERYNDLFLIYTSIFLLLGILSYKIEILGRIMYYATYPYLFFIPYYLKNLKTKASRWFYSLVAICVFIYYVLRLFIYLADYCFEDGIMPYINIFLGSF